jgi:superfamily II DNA or RNA helicase
MKLRDYQEDCVAKLAKSKRGILKVPAGGGKTIIAAAAIARVLAKRSGPAKIHWMAATIDQVNQAKDAIRQFPEIRAGGTAIKVRTVDGTRFFDVNNCDLLVVDECHHAGAESWCDLIEAARNARWGLSATPFGIVEHAAKVKELFGGVVAEIGRESLVEDGHLCRGKVVWHRVKVPATVMDVVLMDAEESLLSQWVKLPPWVRYTITDSGEKEQNKEKRKEMENRCLFAALQNHISEDLMVEPGIALAREAVEAGGSVLILGRTVELCKKLKLGLDDLGCVVLSAKVPKKQRARMLDDLRSGVIRVAAATSLADEGLDVPRLNALIMLTPTRSGRLAEQRTGRVLRMFADKDDGVIHDFVIEHYMLKAQAVARQREYRRLGYEQEEVSCG